jgi:hypothetical protein
MSVSNFKKEGREFSKEFILDDPSNSLRWELEERLRTMGRKFDRWIPYAPLRTMGKKQNALYIDFTGETREDVDFLTIALERVLLSSNHSFKFGFVNLGTHETMSYPKGIDRKGVLYISDITEAG